MPSAQEPIGVTPTPACDDVNSNVEDRGDPGEDLDRQPLAMPTLHQGYRPLRDPCELRNVKLAETSLRPD